MKIRDRGGEIGTFDSLLQNGVPTEVAAIIQHPGHSNLQRDFNDIRVRSFILTGAPLRNTLSAPNAADFVLGITATPFAEC